MNKTDVLTLVWLVILVVGIIGWGKNIYKFTQCDFKAPYKAEIMRGIGISMAPVGAIIGYITIAD